MQIQARIDDRDLQRHLRRLKDTELDRVLVKALNRTAFELLEGERVGVSSSFDFAGSSTRSFLSGKGSFRFDAARPGHLVVRMHPAPKTEGVLIDHVTGGTITPDDRRLRVGSRFAIPVGVRRGARGKVPDAKTPPRLLAPGGRGFIAGDALLERSIPGGAKNRAAGFVFGSRKAARASVKGVARSRVRVLYALAPRVSLDRRFDFYGIARRVAQSQFALKAQQEVARLKLR